MYDIIAWTGHRPDKLGSYKFDFLRPLIDLCEEIIVEQKPSWGFSGMALGFDQMAAQAMCNQGLPWTAVVPFKGQELKWQKASQKYYNQLLEQANDVVYISPGGFTNHAMLKRNKWMVDNANHLNSLWDGSSGGTSHCNEYAAGRIPVTQLWDRWVEWDKKTGANRRLR